MSKFISGLFLICFTLPALAERACLDTLGMEKVDSGSFYIAIFESCDGSEIKSVLRSTKKYSQSMSKENLSEVNQLISKRVSDMMSLGFKLNAPCQLQSESGLLGSSTKWNCLFIAK